MKKLFCLLLTFLLVLSAVSCSIIPVGTETTSETASAEETTVISGSTS